MSFQRIRSSDRNRFLVPVATILCSLAIPASASICHVAVDAAPDGVGDSWAAPMPMQAALDDPTCMEVWVKAGVHVPDIENPQFHIRRDLALYGGFSGTEILRDQRDPAQHVTVLSGDLENDDINLDGNRIAETAADIVGNNSPGVVFMLGSAEAPITANTIVDGFTITAGQAIHAGGGLFCAASGQDAECDPLIRNIAFSGNASVGRGGALGVRASSGASSSPTVVNVTFSGNSATFRGGALAIWSDSSGVSMVNMYNATFYDNSVTSVSGIGGAIDVSGDSMRLYNATLSGNRSNAVSAIYVEVGDIHLHDVIVWGNLNLPTSRQIDSHAFATVTIDHSVVEDAFSGGVWDPAQGIDGGGNLHDDPHLGEFGLHGGSTGTFLLASGSSAIDNGSSRCLPQGFLDTDQRGVVRPQGQFCDIGAVESAYAVKLMVSSVSGEGKVDASLRPEPLSGLIRDCDRFGSMQECSADYPQHSIVQLIATPAPQSMFAGWGGDCDGANLHFDVLLTSPRACTAQFLPIPDANLLVAVDDGRDFAQVGDWLNYSIAISNHSASDLSDIVISDVLPPQLQVESATWQCMPTGNASCTQAGIGDLDDTVDMPGHSSVFYLLTARVMSADGDEVVNQVGATGTSGTITDSDRTGIALFRDGFDSAGGAQPDTVLGTLSDTSSITLTVDAEHVPYRVGTLAKTADGTVRVEHVAVDERTWLRLRTRSGQLDQFSAWSALRNEQAGAGLGLHVDANGGQRVVLVGTERDLDLPVSVDGPLVLERGGDPR